MGLARASHHAFPMDLQDIQEARLSLPQDAKLPKTHAHLPPHYGDGPQGPQLQVSLYFGHVENTFEVMVGELDDDTRLRSLTMSWKQELWPDSFEKVEIYRSYARAFFMGLL